MARAATFCSLANTSCSGSTASSTARNMRKPAVVTVAAVFARGKESARTATFCSLATSGSGSTARNMGKPAVVAIATLLAGGKESARTATFCGVTRTCSCSLAERIGVGRALAERVACSTTTTVSKRSSVFEPDPFLVDAEACLLLGSVDVHFPRTHIFLPSRLFNTVTATSAAERSIGTASGGGSGKSPEGTSCTERRDCFLTALAFRPFPTLSFLATFALRPWKVDRERARVAPRLLFLFRGPELGCLPRFPLRLPLSFSFSSRGLVLFWLARRNGRIHCKRHVPLPGGIQLRAGCGRHPRSRSVQCRGPAAPRTAKAAAVAAESASSSSPRTESRPPKPATAPACCCCCKADAAALLPFPFALFLAFLHAACSCGRGSAKTSIISKTGICSCSTKTSSTKGRGRCVTAAAAAALSLCFPLPLPLVLALTPRH